MNAVEIQKEIKRLKKNLGHGFGDLDPVKRAMMRRIRVLENASRLLER